MSTYLTFFTYAPEAWRAMVRHPEDREKASRKVIESAGGQLRAFYWMLGEHDGLAIFEVPNATSAAAVAAAITASGRISQMRTVHLLEHEEVRGALELAKLIAPAYQPPGGPREDWRADYQEGL
jgi:uncharacterized protein with GYD domain